MKRVFLFMMLLCAFSVACEEPNTQPAERPVITLISPASVTVGSKGGDVVINYTVTNTIEGAEMSVSTAADWIRISPESEFGSALLNIAPNDATEGRDATVTLNYNGVKSFVRITQNAIGDSSAILTLLSDSVVNIDRNRQHVKIEYLLENPSDNGFIYVIAREDWIIGINTDYDGYVDLTIAANESGAERKCDIIVGYDKARIEVVMTQSAEGELVYVAEMLHGYYYGDQFSPGVGNYWLFLTDNGFDDYGKPMPNSTFYRIDAYGPMYTGGEMQVPIPEGRYTLDTTNSYAEWTFSAENSAYYTSDKSGNSTEPCFFESGEMVVERDKISLTLVIDGETHRAVYYGAPILRDEKDTIVVYSTLTEDYEAKLNDHYMLYECYGDFYEYGYINWMFVIMPNSGKGDCFQLDIISGSANTSDGFAGDYVGSDVLAPLSFIPGWTDGERLSGSWYFTDDQEEVAPFRTGEMHITENGNGTMTVEIDIYDDLKNNITATWTGTPEAATSLSSAVYNHTSAMMSCKK